MATNNQVPTRVITDEEVYRHIAMPFGEQAVMKKVKEEVVKQQNNSKEAVDNDAVSSAVMLREFSQGLLLASVTKEYIRPFIAKFSLDLQREYHCDTVAKKSLAELAALNYGRILAIQYKIRGFSEKDEYGEMTVKIIGVLSKEMDRAQRHYLTALQSLEMGVQPPLKVSIHTQHANIANNQAIQQVGEQTNVEAK